MSRRSSVIQPGIHPRPKPVQAGNQSGCERESSLSGSVAPAVCRQRLRGADLRDRLVPVAATGDRLLGRVAGIAARGLHGRPVSGQRRFAAAGLRRGIIRMRVYALLELGIAAFGIIALFGVPFVGRIYVAGATSGLAGLVLRGAVAAVCLLPPTFLMGASLPAIARWVETTPRGVSWLGLLYSANVAGAVIGCLSWPASTCCACTTWRSPLMLRPPSTSRWPLLALALASRHATSETGGIESNRPGRRARRARAHLRRDRAFRPDRARRRSGVDAAALAAARRHRLHVLDHSRRVSHWVFGPAAAIGSFLRGRQECFAIRAWRWPPARSCSRLLSPGPLSRSRAYAALLARRSVALDQPLVQLRSGFHALYARHFPGHAAVGRELSHWRWRGVAADGEDPARLTGSVYAVNTAGSIVGALAFSLCADSRRLEREAPNSC